VKHRRSLKFKECERSLSPEIRSLSKAQYKLLKKDPSHPSLRFKKLGGTENEYSVRVNDDFRALGTKIPKFGVIVWYFVGDHKMYEKIIKDTGASYVPPKLLK
jgi:hypothetical protein